MVQEFPCENQIANPLNVLSHDVCLLVRHRAVPLGVTVVRVVVQNIGITDVLAQHRGRNLGSIRRVLVCNRRVTSPVCIC